MTSWFTNPSARRWSLPDDGSGAAREFHRTLPGYGPTPLVDLPALAAELGVGRVLVKDESSRLGLPAFKILGASWACRQTLDRHPGAHLVTATDGNHGRAVARTARELGTSATVFVPDVMPGSTAARIADEGAQVVRVDGDYDVAVRAAAEHADADPGRELVQDTAWDGYEEVPQWIVEGYRTLLAEVDEALGRQPDLVAVPVGVGSLAQAVVAHYRSGVVPGPATTPTGGDVHPTRVLSVEPDTAAGLLASLRAGTPVPVPTATTVMAGLNCGTVSSLAWPVLQGGCDAAVTVTDAEALAASRDLETLGVSSGPCGAATLAGVGAALADPGRRTDLDLPPDAVVVLLSTEGLDSA
ncbi:pyridoxal-phosphate dependent enzyme [Ornithinimicrobium pekingense]|uniref:Diaminopropionate ammonia-lyase n=1 Tax=Ornithinimicrobium pekingense TaxID=384677 RepID=A0ABQ2FC36_9MICO|nr:pyridoxal-phosphate dependent enzyme [Ornithinimicrobium pekingense]GGK78988.1 diaminopropionate ammonia-lyase [Ornithinimicrobium pekingense]